MSRAAANKIPDRDDSAVPIRRVVIGDVEDVEGFWGPSQQASLQVVMEAMHRFQQVTQDTRSAAALTLAWAALESGYIARPE